MTDLNPIKVMLHDRDEAIVKTETSISMRYDDDARRLRGYTIGEIRTDFNGWMPKDMEMQLAIGSATMRFLIAEEFLRLDEFAMWVGHEDRVKIGMASGCIYLMVTRPEGKKIDLRPGDFPSMCDRINANQSLFKISGGVISYGSPEGGTLQFAYELKD